MCVCLSVLRCFFIGDTKKLFPRKKCFREKSTERKNGEHNKAIFLLGNPMRGDVFLFYARARASTRGRPPFFPTRARAIRARRTARAIDKNYKMFSLPFFQTFLIYGTGCSRFLTRHFNAASGSNCRCNKKARTQTKHVREAAQKSQNQSRRYYIGRFWSSKKEEKAKALIK